MKFCSSCRAELLPADFYADASRKDGLTHACRICHRARSAAYRAANPEKVRAYKAKHRKSQRPYKPRRTIKWVCGDGRVRQLTRIEPEKVLGKPPKIVFTPDGAFLLINGELTPL